MRLRDDVAWSPAQQAGADAISTVAGVQARALPENAVLSVFTLASEDTTGARLMARLAGQLQHGATAAAETVLGLGALAGAATRPVPWERADVEPAAAMSREVWPRLIASGVTDALARFFRNIDVSVCLRRSCTVC